MACIRVDCRQVFVSRISRRAIGVKPTEPKAQITLVCLSACLVLSLLGCVRLFELLHNYRLASQSYHAVEVGRRLADLIYELQQERGLSAAYITCNGECFADSLQVQQQRVSAQITALQNSPHLLQLSRQLSPAAQHLLQTKLEALRLGKQALENNRLELLSVMRAPR